MSYNWQNFNSRACWFVGAKYSGTEDQTERFFREGIWQNGYDNKYLETVKSIQVGDRIAIKSSYTRKHGLTFDNRGLTVSVMAIKVIGTVKGNVGDGRTVMVEWEPVRPLREWYFFTNRSTIWRVVPGNWVNDALIAFAFEHKEQDIDRFRNAPYWRQRFGDWSGSVETIEEAESGEASRTTLYEGHWHPLVKGIPQQSSICILTGPNGSGKTRALADLSSRVLHYSHGHHSFMKYDRIICLSGTVLDKFPRSSPKNDNYVYFGRKTSNNMFSEIAPFRRLCPYLLTPATDRQKRIRAASKILCSIGLSPEIKLHFRRGQSSSSSSNYSEPAFDLDPFLISVDHLEFDDEVNAVLQDTVHLGSITFKKNNEKVQLVDLSSGERAYVLTALVLAFVTIDNTIVFFDEPENSLHPKWQSSIMRDMWDTISEVSVNSRAIIATHSPLIVSGAKGRDTFIYDLDSDKVWVPSQMYGRTSDCILKEQFKLHSPRSMSAMIAIQNSLSAAMTIEHDPKKFRMASDALLQLDLQLDADDPLYETLNTLKELRKAMK